MKQAVMFGAGNVGRGFLGQLFTESGYQVTFVDVDQPLVKGLNERGSYTLRLVSNGDVEELTIGPVRAIDGRDRAAAAEALSRADLAATAVGAGALKAIAPTLAAGIALRAIQENLAPLNIIICENLHDAADYLRGLIREHLTPDQSAFFDEHVGLVMAVIARMVPLMTAEMRAEDPTLIVAEPFKRLPVDANAFVGPIPDVVGLEPRANFVAYVDRKLYIHNAGHAMLGYLGYQRGLTYGYESLTDPVVRPLFDQALHESRQALIAEHAFDPQALDEHIADLTRRFANRALGDTTFRLARDPLRKLAPADRLVGAARLAEKHGIALAGLPWGIAAGLCFDAPEDEGAVALQGRLAHEGLEATMAAVCGIHAHEPLGVAVVDCYRRVKAGALA